MKLIYFTILFLFTEICYTQVIINEIQSSNSSTIADEFGEYDDWIEIYNPNDYTVDIGGLVLKDNVDTWQVPVGDTGTILAPEGYFLLWADDEEIQGKFHTNFKLSASNGEFLGLYEPDSVTLIESVNIPPLSENQSYGKCNDTAWIIFSQPTPLLKNFCLSSTKNISKNNDFALIYPNPAKFHIKINFIDKAIVQVYNIHGQLMIKKHISANDNIIPINNLPSGSYMVKIINNMHVHSEILIIE